MKTITIIKEGKKRTFSHGWSAYAHAGCRCRICVAAAKHNYERFLAQHPDRRSPPARALEPVNPIRTWSELRIFRMTKGLPHFVP